MVNWEREQRTFSLTILRTSPRGTFSRRSFARRGGPHPRANSASIFGSISSSILHLRLLVYVESHVNFVKASISSSEEVETHPKCPGSKETESSKDSKDEYAGCIGW